MFSEAGPDTDLTHLWIPGETLYGIQIQIQQQLLVL